MSQYSDSKFNFEDPNTSWYKTFRLIPEKSLVMDIGCSSGTFGSELIKQKKCTVDGIEIDDSDIEKAKRKLRKVYKINIEVENVDIEEKYDIAFMGDVIEHLARPIDALKKIRRLLKPSGRLVFSMPNSTHMLVRLMLLKGVVKYGKTGLFDETHLHVYNREEIYRILNNAGYEIEKFDFTVNDMPYDLLKKELEDVGLVANKKFQKVSSDVNAVAYQFIGVARVAKATKTQKLPKLSPRNIVNDYIEEMKNEYQKIVEDLSEDRQKVVDDRDRILADRDNIAKKLAELENRWYMRYSRKIKRKQER